MKVTIMISLLLMLSLSGCIQTVHSWEKEQLSKQIMKEENGNTLLQATKAHIYYSKEATIGGTGLSGGGCGCN
jgi:hypothetical protein